MSTLILTRGIPASGKSTWAREFVAEQPGRIRLNRDDLRQMLHGKRWGLEYQDEERITRIQQAAARDALARGYDVVVDDMNLRAKYVKAWMKLAADSGAEFSTMTFLITLDEAIARDADRDPSVGADVIRDIYTRFTNKGALPLLPELDAADRTGLEPYVPDTTKTQAFIFDIDGTLAHIVEGGRSPYDGERVHEDILDKNVAHLMRELEFGHVVIVMSGRDAKYEAVTRAWLEENNVRFDELYMRPEGDTRKDQVVKAELFDAHVRHRFNVLGVFDDRNRVVEMWRALGLTTYQVAEGDF